MAARTKLERMESVANVLQSSLTVAAIIAAGLWFWWQGEFRERLNVDHDFQCRQLTSKWVWIHLAMDIENVGRRDVDLQTVKVWTQKIVPMDKDFRDQLLKKQHLVDPETGRVQWRVIDKTREIQLERKIAPGESDQQTAEFIVPSRVRTVRLYSYLEQPDSSKPGWETASIHSISEEACN